MISKIIDGISLAIHEEFGDSYDIYTDTVEQDLTEPCFTILCLNPKIDLFLGNKYLRRNQFCIHYFPETDEPKQECIAVAERLLNVLELITVEGDLTRGTDMQFEIEDDVLSLFVNYDMFVRKASAETTPMENLELMPNVRE